MSWRQLIPIGERVRIMAEIEEAQDQIAALEATLAGSAAMVVAFDGELSRMQESLVFTGREVNTLSNGLGGGLRRAFDGLVFDGMKLSDALKGIGRTLSDTVYGIAMKPVQNAVGGALAQGLNGLLSNVMPFEKGGSFAQGRVMPFAKGGVVAQATSFPMRGGTGLMGEAGPEVITAVPVGGVVSTDQRTVESALWLPAASVLRMSST